MRAAAILLVLAVGCEGSSGGAPAPLSVTPPTGADGSEVAVTISGDHFNPAVFTDHGRASGSRLSVAFEAQLESETGTPSPLKDLVWVDARTLTGVVPAGTPRGAYHLTVRDPSGREGRLEGAFRVVSSAENVAGFLIDPLGPQKLGIPFVLTATAIDEESSPVDGFDGTALLSSSDGALNATPLGPFVRGRFRGFVTLERLATRITLSIADTLGHRGESDAFDVLPGTGAKVAYLAPIATVAAGSCSAPFSLELQDTFGKPAIAQAAVMIAVAANPPEGMEFFSDAACQVALSSARLEAMASRAQFFTRGVRAGAVQLRAVPDGFPSVVHALEVQPLAASRLAFLSPEPSLAAGGCSPSIEVQAEDLHGNASSTATALPLIVSVTPPAGVTLWAGAGCATALGELQLAAGASVARFNLRSVAAGTLKVVVQGPPDAGSFGPIEQRIEVLP